MEDGARFRVKGSSDSYESHFSLKDLFEFLTRFRVKGSSDSYESHFSLKDLFEFLTRFRGGVAPQAIRVLFY